MKILVIDVEATCWDNGDPAKQPINDIIEIGVTPIDITQDRPVMGESESIIVLPTATEISPFCTQLTTLTAEFVKANGRSFKDAIEYLRTKYHTDSLSTDWASWGDYDRHAFERQCQRENVAYPFADNSHSNIKALFSQKYGFRCGMDSALKKMGIILEGTHHRGIDDSRNIAKILISLGL